jgi:hypothetical protein
MHILKLHLYIVGTFNQGCGIAMPTNPNFNYFACPGTSKKHNKAQQFSE